MLPPRFRPTQLLQESQVVLFDEEVSQPLQVDARSHTATAERDQTKGLRAVQRLAVQLGTQRIPNQTAERLPPTRRPLFRLSQQGVVDRNRRAHASQITVPAS